MAINKFNKTPTPIEVTKKINELIDGTNNEINILQRSKAYAVGDIAYSQMLPSWARLECVQSGITALVQPEWTKIHGG